MKTGLMLALCLVGVATQASAQTEVQMQQAEIISVMPVYERVVVGKHCYQVVYQPQQTSYIGPVIGAIAGGLLGAQIGGGSGRQVAIGVGAATGAMVGDRLSTQSQPGQVSTECSHVTDLRHTGNQYVAQTASGHRVTGYSARPVQLGDRVDVQVVTTLQIR